MAISTLLSFGDASQSTREIRTSIHSLDKNAKSSFLVTQFLKLSLKSLRKQLADAKVDDRGIFAPYKSLMEIADRKPTDDFTDGVVRVYLHAVVQLGLLILQAERNPHILEHDASKGTRTVIGFCSGLIVGAAAATARNALQLVEIGSEILGVALRLALFSQHRAHAIESGSGRWAAVLTTTETERLQNELDIFHEQNDIPKHRAAYISAELKSSTTISAPPSILRNLVATSSFVAHHLKIELPVYGAYHAPHLGPVDHKYIIGKSSLLDIELAPNVSVFSTSTGQPYQATTLRSLLQNVLDDSLRLPLRIKSTISSYFEAIEAKEITLFAFGSASVDALISQECRAAKIALRGDSAVVEQQHGIDHGAIAVVGMAGRFPGGQDLDSFWDVLEQGKDLHSKVPKDRFDFDQHCDPTGVRKNAPLSAYGCFIDNPGLFDARLFNMSPREALQTDPTHRLLLMTTYEALEMAGYNPYSQSNEKIGTYIGMATDDYREHNMSQDIDIYYVSGGIRAFAAGRINYHFKWDGPSYVIDTVCSSSAASVELACAALIKGTIDTAVAGGGNVITGPDLFAGLSRGGFLSSTGSSKTFDDSADGYCRGDAIGVVILKRLEDALANNDNILGLIRSSGTNHSAFASSMTHPHSATQQKLCKQVLNDAGLEARDIDYVEMHGTGTQAGDTTEMKTVVETFGESVRSDPLFVGSLKSNIGHGEGAAGITSVIKTMMMFRKDTIPQHVGIKSKISQKLPQIADKNIHIARKNEAFQRNSEKPRRILLNCFGATGGNTCMILEDAPRPPSRGLDPRSHHVVVVSAKTRESLSGNQKKLLNYITKNRLRIQDLAYTTTARRIHHQHRSVHVVRNVAELVSKLTAAISPDQVEQIEGSEKAQVTFLFPGQGSIFAGMGQQLFETSPIFRNELTKLNDISIRLGFKPFLSIVVDVGTNLAQQDPSQIHQALVSFEIALGRLWLSWGVKPDVLIGHSLGEYAALCVAEVLSPVDTLYLVGKRAELIDRNCARYQHGMLLIMASSDEVQGLLVEQSMSTSCTITCLNGPHATVVGGPTRDLQRLHKTLSQRSTVLDIDYAFHTSQMDLILSDFKKVAESVRFAKPTIPIASTLLRKVIDTAGVFNSSYLAQQTRHQVSFVGALQACEATGLLSTKSFIVELGPGTATLNMAKSVLGMKPNHLLPCRKPTVSCWETLSTSLAAYFGACGTVNWREFHRPHEADLTLLELPSYHFALKNYWIQYDPHKSTKAIANDVSANLNTSPSMLSTCIHKIDEEDLSGPTPWVVFSTDLKEPEFLKLLKGHCISNIPLCPTSVISECALTAGTYVLSTGCKPVAKPTFRIDNLEIFSPLTSRSEAVSQRVKIDARKRRDSNSVDIKISSDTDSRLQDHARCTLHVDRNSNSKAELSGQNEVLVDRMKVLMAAESADTVHRLLKDMVYKLFSELVQYTPEYREIEEIFHSSDSNEAVAKIRFRQTPRNCDFTYDPCWTDSIAQVAGFVLNGSVNTPSDVMYMSTGWDAFHLAGELSESRQYLCYVQARVGDSPKTYICDVTLFDNDKAIAVASGLKFQEIKRTILPRLLGSAEKTKASMLEQTKAQQTKRTTRISAPKFQNATQVVTTLPQNSATALSGGAVGDVAQIAKFLQNPDSSRTCHKFLTILAEEVGVTTSELLPNTSLEELGVDSLLTISLTGKAQSQLGLDLPASLFATCETVGDLQNYFMASDEGETETATAPSAIHEPTPVKDTACEFSAATMIPSSVHPTYDDPKDIDSDSPDNKESFRSTKSTNTPATSVYSETAVPNKLLDSILSIIVQETGADPSEMTDEASLEELGVDSLMSIAIVGTVADQTGTQLPASILNENATVGELKRALAPQYASDTTAPDLTVPEVLPQSSTPQFSSTQPSKTEMEPQPIINASVESKMDTHEDIEPMPPVLKPKLRQPFDKAKYSCNAVLIQGDRNSPLPPVFMLADGAGSATSYLHFPQMKERMPVYAIESPFLHCPFEFDCAIEEMSGLAVDAIRRIKPHGPYILGGWSMGGTYAYDTARQLGELGETILGLLLIDAACPTPMRALPNLTIEVMAEVGIFIGIPTRGGKGDKPMPAGQKQHLLACVRSVTEYEPKPLAVKNRPQNTYIMWSRFGMFENLTPKLTEALNFLASQQAGKEKIGINRDWLSGERTDFDPKGWDKLLGPDNIEVHPVDGDHFSIMRVPRIKTETGRLMQQAVTKFMHTLQNPACLPLIQTTPSVKQQISAQEAFHQTRYDHDDFEKQVGFSDWWSEVYPIHQKMVLAHVVEAFAVMGCNISTMKPGSIFPMIEVLPKYGKLFDHLWDILEDGGLLKNVGKRRVRTSNPVDPTNSFLISKELIMGFPKHVSMHQLIGLTGSRLADILIGNEDPLNLVFRKNTELLEEVYANSPHFATTIRHLGKFLADALRYSKKHVQILEVGAGVGGTTEHILDILKKIGISYTYTYTDISVSLVNVGRQKFGSENMEYMPLNIEKSPPEKLIGKYDIIISTNCFHTTKSLEESGKHACMMLKPDGFLCLAELTRRLYWYELVWGLFDGWWQFQDGRNYALTGPDGWNNSLRAAGFQHVSWSDSRSLDPPVSRIIAAFPAPPEKQDFICHEVKTFFKGSGNMGA